MTAAARSKNGVPIRVTDERWAHITEEHCELAGMRLEVLETLSGPERILAGRQVSCSPSGEVEAGKCLVAVYRENEDDGFLITAFLTRRLAALARRRQVWP